MAKIDQVISDISSININISAMTENQTTMKNDIIAIKNNGKETTRRIEDNSKEIIKLKAVKETEKGYTENIDRRSSKNYMFWGTIIGALIGSAGAIIVGLMTKGV